MFDRFPAQSWACHVLVLAYAPGQLPGTVTSDTSVTTGLGSLPSDAVGAVKSGADGHSMVALAPHAPRMGAVVSFTVIF
jgi:hypothetical protein